MGTHLFGSPCTKAPRIGEPQSHSLVSTGLILGQKAFQSPANVFTAKQLCRPAGVSLYCC